MPTGKSPPLYGLPEDLPKFARAEVGSSLPQGYLRPSVPRAAFSHSASVGKRLPAHVQYARASSQDTYATGSSGSALVLGLWICRSLTTGDFGTYGRVRLLSDPVFVSRCWTCWDC